MTDKEYRAHPAVSRSELWKISESPQKFKYYKEHPEDPTPALLFGQVFHKMALQPETFFEEFIVAPNCDRRSKTGKEEYAAFLGNAADKTVISFEMFDQAKEMCEALMNNEFVQKLLSGEKEKPFFWVDDLTGEECKCRTDVITKIGDMPLIVDLKTAACAETEAFIKSAVNHGYDFQTAMYCEGVKTNTGINHDFVFIVIEKDPPYAVNILQADKLFIQRGYDVFRELIGIYHDCKISDNWYGYLGKHNMVNNLGLPLWLAKEIE